MGFREQHTPEFWQSRFGTAEGVRHWHIYAYEYLDDLSFMPAAREFFQGWPEGDLIVERVQQKFRELGWAGDGEVQVMWLPPFAGAGPHDFLGCYVLHVKQEEDGISWLACPFLLPFDRLFQRDDATYDDPGSTTSERDTPRKGMVRWLSDFRRK